ncbi:hypothetical protein BDQ17DRAFT_1351746 [Cyathus striatus]|nr:hypothetical protein BDQ17DRAFT_1351746 [Cyathus striatus]
MLIDWDSTVTPLHAPGPSGRHPKVKEHDRKRMNPSARIHRMDRVANSKRKFDKKAFLNQKQADQLKEIEFTYVFIGNITPGTPSEDIRQFFSSCGEVTKVTIRCSRGQGVTATVLIPDELRRPRDTQYATVEFTHSRSAMFAMRLNGRLLNGYPVVVCASPADLPEVQDMVQTRVGKMQKHGLPHDIPPRIQSNRPLAHEDTEEVIDANADRDRHRIFGYSFAKCVV